MTHPALHESELLAADAVGDVIEYWGFRKALGRVWTVLYLSGQSLSAADIADRLQMSAGAVSMSVNELQRWTVIRRVWQPGERRDFYEAETDLWKMIAKVINERERTLASQVTERLERAMAMLDKAPRSAEVEARRERLRHLLGLASVGERIIEMFVRSGVADFASFSDILRQKAPPAARRGRA